MRSRPLALRAQGHARSGTTPCVRGAQYSVGVGVDAGFNSYSSSAAGWIRRRQCPPYRRSRETLLSRSVQRASPWTMRAEPESVAPGLPAPNVLTAIASRTSVLSVRLAVGVCILRAPECRLRLYPLGPRGRRGATRWPRRGDADLRLTLQACNRHPVVSAELERLQGVIVHVDEPQPRVAHSLAGIQGMFDLQVESVPLAREHLAHPVRYERKVRGVEQRWHALPAPSDQCRHHALLAEAQRLRTPDSRRAERRWCGRSARCGCGRGSAHPGRCGGCRR